METVTVRKIQQLYDESAEVWSDIYEAPGIEGRLITAEVSRDEQHPNTVRRHLLRKGAEAEALTDSALISAIATQAPVVRRAARTGWRDDDSCFVAHGYVAGGTEGSTVVPPVCPLIGSAGQLQVCGTLAEWQRLIAVARYSTVMIVALSALFAAPLLALLRRPSFALVFFGPSKIGKSFAQLTAASALGFGREQDLPSLNATPAGLLAAALSFNDHMLVINEVGTAKGTKREIYDVLREATYALLGGQDTKRHPSWSGTTGGAASTYQVIVTMSSEISPDAWAARNGEARDDGEMARLIGVPVQTSGNGTIFDRVSPTLSGRARSDWEKQQFKRLTEDLPNQRGVAFRGYLDTLLTDVAQVQIRARELAAYFENEIGSPDLSPVARDIVAKFGILLAGGMIAIDAGILPFDGRTVGGAVRRACMAALAELPDPRGELRADLDVLKARLTGGGIIDLDACTRRELHLMRDADGFRRPKGCGEEFVVRAQSFTG